MKCYADYIMKFLLYFLEQAEKSIDRYVNSEKTDFMCFKLDGSTSTLNDKPLKYVNKFTNIGSNISFTESNVNTRIGKIWIVIDS